jgi:hypoxanthine phosphoribosyltransferase
MLHPLSFSEIASRLEQCPLPDVDAVVGIGEGGVVPASLAAYAARCDLAIVRVRYRDDRNVPLGPDPVLLDPFKPPSDWKRVLLVDDVSVSGKTLDFARALFDDVALKTLVFKGKADIVLFPEIESCVRWPWKRYPNPQASPPESPG